MRALIEVPDLVDRFESSAVHWTVIMAFESAALLSSLDGDASLHDGDTVK